MIEITRWCPFRPYSLLHRRTGFLVISVDAVIFRPPTLCKWLITEFVDVKTLPTVHRVFFKSSTDATHQRYSYYGKPIIGHLWLSILRPNTISNRSAVLSRRRIINFQRRIIVCDWRERKSDRQIPYDNYQLVINLKPYRC